MGFPNLCAKLQIQICHELYAEEKHHEETCTKVAKLFNVLGEVPNPHYWKLRLMSLDFERDLCTDWDDDDDDDGI